MSIWKHTADTSVAAESLEGRIDVLERELASSRAEHLKTQEKLREVEAASASSYTLLGRKLSSMLQEHAGETGVSEGAADVLKRIIQERDQAQWSQAQTLKAFYAMADGMRQNRDGMCARDVVLRVVMKMVADAGDVGAVRR